MIRIFQALDAYGEQRVLLLALTDLEVIPNVGEDFQINDKEFMVLKVKHVLETGSMTQAVELLVAPPEALVDVEYIMDDEYDL